MNKAFRTFARYLQTYGLHGFFLYVQIYWLRKKCVNLKGCGTIYFRRKTYDIEVFNQIFIYREYDLPVKGNIKFIVDLGANNGLSALFFHKKFPEAIIYALEPDKDNFLMLQQNTQRISNIVPLNKAIWKEDGIVNLSSGESWNIHVSKEPQGSMAEATTIETLMTKYNIPNIDLLKVDIECAEKDIFEGSGNFLHKTNNIAIELHDWITPGCSEAFFRALFNYSYDFASRRENIMIAGLRPRV